MQASTGPKPLSTGSPRTLKIRPRVAPPTGTFRENANVVQEDGKFTNVSRRREMIEIEC